MVAIQNYTKKKYYGDAAFDMEQLIEKDDYTRLSMLWNSKTNKFGLYAGGRK